MQTNNIKDRIIAFVNAIGVDKATFERQCGLSNGFVNNTNGNIRYKSIEAILKGYPQLNRDWLINGTGDMIIEQEEKEPSLSSFDKIINDYRNTIEELRNDKRELRKEIERLRTQIETLQN